MENVIQKKTHIMKRKRSHIGQIFQTLYFFQVLHSHIRNVERESFSAANFHKKMHLTCSMKDISIFLHVKVAKSRIGRNRTISRISLL